MTPQLFYTSDDDRRYCAECEGWYILQTSDAEEPGWFCSALCEHDRDENEWERNQERG